MGANRTAPTPEAYPIAFLNAVREGHAVLHEGDLPWTAISAAKRFRLFLRLLRTLPSHPLHPGACGRWSVRPISGTLHLSRGPSGKATVTRPGAALIAAALSRGGQ